MKAYTLKGIGQLEYADVPMPDLQSGWALVQVGAAGICGSDIPRIFQTGTYHFPTIPGHEFAGKVVDVYDQCDREWIGKRAGVFPLIPCKQCAACQKEQYEMCSHYDYLGSRRDGGFAEFVAVPVWNLLELPENMTMKEAAMLEPSSVALHAVRRLELHREDSAALFGLGTIGLLIVQWLCNMGLQDVFAVGHDPGHGKMMRQVVSDGYRYKNTDRDQRTEHNHQLDETAAWILEETKGEGVSVVIDCIGTSDSIKSCLDCVKPGGQLLAVANPKGDVFLDKQTYWKILRKQIRLVGTWNSSFCHSKEDDWHTVKQFCSSGKFRLQELITHSLAFDQLLQGLEIAGDHAEYHNKIMICKDIS